MKLEKNIKKSIILLSIIIIIILAVVICIVKARSNYLYNEDGTLTDGHAELIENLKKTEDEETKKKKTDFYLQQNILTQDEADEIYKSIK